MRQVRFYEWRRVTGQNNFEKVEIGTATFHCFGMDYEEFESGHGQFSTAVIELSDGTVKNIPVELIKFI